MFTDFIIFRKRCLVEFLVGYYCVGSWGCKELWSLRVFFLGRGDIIGVVYLWRGYSFF